MKKNLPRWRHRERELSITRGQRFETGIIATLVRDAETRTFHQTGTATNALRSLSERCDSGGWKIQSLSTPKTIFRDLVGDRIIEQGASPAHTNFPENSLLALIGRLDLMSDNRSIR